MKAMKSCRTSREVLQPPVHAGMGPASGFKEGVHPSLPSLARFTQLYMLTVSLKIPITEIHFIAAHFLVLFHDRKYRTKAPKSLYCPQWGKEAQSWGVLSSA